MEIKNIDELRNLEIDFPQNKITSLIIKNEVILKKWLNEYYNKVDDYVLNQLDERALFNINILEDIKYYLKKFEKEKLIEMLNSFNLNEQVLDKCYIELSASETKKIMLIIILLSNTQKIVLIHPTENLDIKSIQTLQKHLRKIKRRDKKIIIITNDTNFMLEISDKIALIDIDKKLYEGNKYEILSDENILNKAELKTPNILKFIKQTKQLKNIKLGYRDNINDLIKDIYRNAN